MTPTLIRPTETKRSRNGKESMVDGGNGDAGRDGADENVKENVGRIIAPVEEAVGEGTKPKPMRQPYQPTPAQIAEHELTHIPFRDWCVHCMKGRGQANHHRSDQNKKMEGEEGVQGAATTFSIDYMFLTINNELITQEEADKM